MESFRSALDAAKERSPLTSNSAGCTPTYSEYFDKDAKMNITCSFKEPKMDRLP